MFGWLKRPQGAPERRGITSRALIALSDAAMPRWSPRDYRAFAEGGYAGNPVGFRCVRMISEAAASVSFEVRRAGASVASDDPAARLLARPNPDQAGATLFEAFYSYLSVAGNAYLHAAAVDTAPRALFVLRPDRMRVLARGQRGTGAAGGWEHKVGEVTTRFMRDPATGRAPILHMKVFHPGDDHYGLSAMAPASFALDTHAASGAWNKALLDNAARPSGALVFSGEDGAGRLTDEQFARLKDELANAHQGPGGAGRPLLLEGGLDWKPFGLSPADMDFVEAKHTAAREIALALGVPPMLLGIPGDNTYANYKEANLAFWRQTILPLTRRTARALEGWLAAWFGDDLQIVCREDEIPALAEERAAYWRSLEAVSFLTPSEKRRLAGLSPCVDEIAAVAATSATHQGDTP